MVPRIRRKIGSLATAGLLLAGSLATPAWAQYQAAPIHCVDGTCRTSVANFGYYEPRWRRWPTQQASAQMPVKRGVGQPLDPSIPGYEAPDIQGEADITPRPRNRMPSVAPQPIPRDTKPRGPSLLDPPSRDIPQFELPPSRPEPAGPPATPTVPGEPAQSPLDLSPMPPESRPGTGNSDLDLFPAPRPNTGGTRSSDLDPSRDNAPFDPFGDLPGSAPPNNGMGQRPGASNPGWTAARRETVLHTSLYAPRLGNSEPTPDRFVTPPATDAGGEVRTASANQPLQVPSAAAIPAAVQENLDHFQQPPQRRSTIPAYAHQPAANQPKPTAETFQKPLAPVSRYLTDADAKLPPVAQQPVASEMPQRPATRRPTQFPAGSQTGDARENPLRGGTNGSSGLGQNSRSNYSAERNNPLR